MACVDDGIFSAYGCCTRAYRAARTWLLLALSPEVSSIPRTLGYKIRRLRRNQKAESRGFGFLSAALLGGVELGGGLSAHINGQLPQQKREASLL